MIRYAVIVSVLAVGGSLSCQARQGDTPQAAGGREPTTDTVVPLEGTLWEFVEVEGEPVVHFDQEEVPQIRFIADGRTLTASLSCNLFNGTYETEGEDLRVELAPVSWRECQASHGQEELLRRVIQSVTSYRVEDDRLLLFAGSGVVAILVPMEQP